VWDNWGYGRIFAHGGEAPPETASYGEKARFTLVLQGFASQFPTIHAGAKIRKGL